MHQPGNLGGMGGVEDKGKAGGPGEMLILMQGSGAEPGKVVLLHGSSAGPGCSTLSSIPNFGQKTKA